MGFRYFGRSGGCVLSSPPATFPPPQKPAERPQAPEALRVVGAAAIAPWAILAGRSVTIW